jgi:hypothetical protein
MLPFINRGWMLVSLAAAGLAGGPGRLEADTINLTSVADTTLFEESPDNNLGKSTPMVGVNAHGKKSRMLLRFDLGSVPTNAVISAATLKLKVVRTPSGGATSNFDLRRVFKAWGEGAKGSPNSPGFENKGAVASANEATWKARLSPTLWTTPGGSVGTDFSSTVSATTLIAGNATYTFASTADLVADVQSWVSTPDSNFGWVVISRAESSVTPRTVRRVGSREIAANAPVLTVTFTVETPAQPPTLSQPQLVGNQLRFTFSAEANRGYTVEVSEPLTQPSWTVLRSIASSPTATTVEVQDAITLPHRYYRVRTP